MKRITAVLIVFALFLPTCAFALTGQSYATFSDYYKANVTFINDNDNRHLLPMVLSQRNSTMDDGRVYYDLYGDVLTVTVATDSDGVIEECEIRLTAPAGLTLGTSVYNDFAISGYHSYAFLMAMDTSADSGTRYQLVNDVVQGMKDNNGAYSRQLGVYTLTCTRQNNMAILNFYNDGVVVETPTPEPTATPAPGDADDVSTPEVSVPEETISPDDYVG